MKPAPTLLSFDHALALLRDYAGSRPLPAETVPLQRALGRVLAGDVSAPIALPGFDNSAMDGYALRGLEAAGQGWALVGEQFAGADRHLALGPGEACRITTGAPLPEGTEAVLIQEQAELREARVFATGTPRPGDHIRRAGEDVRAGDIVLRRGEVLTPARIALAAALGHPGLDVARRPTVAVFTTGDELRPPGQPLAPGEIHDSNRALLQTLLVAEGLEPVAWPILPDDPAVLGAALADAAFSFDLVLTCGGVSAGEKDHLPALLAERGEVLFWKLRMKPGMPVLAGRLGEATVLGLPGNPVSVLATFVTLVRPLLDAWAGRREARPRWRARLAAPVSKRHARREFLRGRLEVDATGQLQAWPDAATGSHRLAAAAANDVLLDLAEGAGEFAIGTVVECIPCAPGRG